MDDMKGFHMNTGNGDASYAKNSCFQEVSVKFLQPYLEECINDMGILPCDTFRIADLGCAVGPNTLYAVHNISSLVQQKYTKSATSFVPRQQAFFSDLPGNDFNLLFNTLAFQSPAPPYFAAAVAGSFHRRLFPRNYLHFVHSCYSLHWLSKVPEKVLDKTSSSWNGEHVFISKRSPREVAIAYLDQFKHDIRCFLAARSYEIVQGGQMFIYLSGRDTSDIRDQGSSGIIGDILNDTFEEMVIEELVDKGKTQLFNLPFFAPSAKEMMGIVNEEGSFTPKRIEFLRGVVQDMNTHWSHIMAQSDNEQVLTLGKMVAMQFRAILEVMLASHFTKSIIDTLFDKFAKHVTKHAASLVKSNVEGGGILLILERI